MLYLGNKHNLWKTAAKIAAGLAVLAVVGCIGLYGELHDYQRKQRELKIEKQYAEQRAKVAAMEAAEADAACAEMGDYKADRVVQYDKDTLVGLMCQPTTAEQAKKDNEQNRKDCVQQQIKAFCPAGSPCVRESRYSHTAQQLPEFEEECRKRFPDDNTWWDKKWDWFIGAQKLFEKKN